MLANKNSLANSNSQRYLILSGGLGSSPYLMKRLQAAFVHDSHIAAPSLEILVSEEPYVWYSFLKVSR